jgi:hypothetical protein
MYQGRAAAADRQQVAKDAVSVRRDSSVDRAGAERTTAHEMSLRAGNAFVDNAIANGTWDPSNLGDFLTATPNLSEDERTKMLERLTTAVNTDRVHLDLTR